MASKDAVTVLRKARALIEDPERWTQGVLARSRSGLEVDPDHPRAVCWCLEGALSRVCAGASTSVQFGEVWKALRQVADGLSPVTVNDTRPHAEVLALFDRAIARLESEAS